MPGTRDSLECYFDHVGIQYPRPVAVVAPLFSDRLGSGTARATGFGTLATRCRRCGGVWEPEKMTVLLGRNAVLPPRYAGTSAGS